MTTESQQLQQAAIKLQQLLQDRTYRGEAKSWLASTSSQLQHISPAARWACFHPCSPDQQQQGGSSPVAGCTAAEIEVLQLLVETAPADVSTLLLRDPGWLCSFLTASRERIKAWFGHFGPTGISQFKHGARALANYALAERAEVWRHLVWSGKHSQSPVAVAVKPHYFGELDVVATVQNLAQSCPGFWHSDELMRSCQAGEWLVLDSDAVVKELRRLLHDGRSSRQQPLRQLLSDFLAAAGWPQLCHRLLPLLTDEGLMQVARTLAADCQHQLQEGTQQRRQQATSSPAVLLSWCSKQSNFTAQHVVSAEPAATATTGEAAGAALQSAAAAAVNLPCVHHGQLLLLGCLQSAGAGVGGWDLDQLLLANALTCYRSQLLALLAQDEETAGLLMALLSTAAAVCRLSGPETELPAVDPGNSTPGVSLPLSAAGGADHHQTRLVQLPAAVHALPRPEQLLVLLVAGWLLRFYSLLQLCLAVSHQGSQQQQVPQELTRAGMTVMLPAGGICHCLMSTAAGSQQDTARPLATTKADVLQHEQHHRTPAPLPAGQEQGQEQQQRQQPAKQPLRRGTPVAAAAGDVGVEQAHHSSDRHGPQDTELGHKHKKQRRKGKRTKTSSKKRRHRHVSSSSSSSDGPASDVRSSGSSSSSGRRHRKRKRKRRHKSSSSRDTSDEEGEWVGLDLDAGGELLDPADFGARPSSRGRHSAGRRQAYGADITLSVTDAGAEPCQQPQGDVGSGSGFALPVVLDLLSSLSVGGRLWQWPVCVAALPATAGCAGDRAAGDRTSSGVGAVMGPRCLPISGSLTEVADAAAQFWLCSTLQQILC